MWQRQEKRRLSTIPGKVISNPLARRITCAVHDQLSERQWCYCTTIPRAIGKSESNPFPALLALATNTSSESGKSEYGLPTIKLTLKRVGEEIDFSKSANPLEQSQNTVPATNGVDTSDASPADARDSGENTRSGGRFLGIRESTWIKVSALTAALALCEKAAGVTTWAMNNETVRVVFAKIPDYAGTALSVVTFAPPVHEGNPIVEYYIDWVFTDEEAMELLVHYEVPPPNLSSSAAVQRVKTVLAIGKAFHIPKEGGSDEITRYRCAFLARRYVDILAAKVETQFNVNDAVPAGLTSDYGEALTYLKWFIDEYGLDESLLPENVVENEESKDRLISSPPRIN